MNGPLSVENHCGPTRIKLCASMDSEFKHYESEISVH